MDHKELLKKDTQRMKRQETLQDNALSKLAEVEAALHDVGKKHEVLFIGDSVINCRRLAGQLNMHPGFSCHYEQHGEKVPEETHTIVFATHDLEVLDRVKRKANGVSIVVMTQDEPPPSEVTELLPEAFVAWNFPAAFGHITKAAAAPV